MRRRGIQKGRLTIVLPLVHPSSEEQLSVQSLVSGLLSASYTLFSLPARGPNVSSYGTISFEFTGP